MLGLKERGSRALFLSVAAWFTAISRAVAGLVGFCPAIAVLPADFAGHGALAAGIALGIG